MKTAISLFALLICTSPIFSQTGNDLIKEFQDSDWVIVADVKEKIENQEAEYIPELIKLLDNKTMVKLTNTGDLIYPGADKFYGHGQIIDYDIDNISIRAGWLLEEITFKNFGFSGVHSHPNKLLGFIKSNFSNFYIAYTTELENMSEDKLREVILTESIKQANKWWDKNKSSWTRLNSIMEALESYDPIEQVNALSYLRNGSTKCTGLTNEYYKTDLYSTINNLKNSEIKRISEQANLILDDTSLEWLEIKGSN